jgi:hypothetical protein
MAKKKFATLIVTKVCLATFCAISSQTHLVTLSVANMLTLNICLQKQAVAAGVIPQHSFLP